MVANTSVKALGLNHSSTVLWPTVALTGDKLRVLEVVAVVLPIRSLVDELRVARIAGSPQFEPAGQNRF
jgi:hypothetical protein